MAELRVKGTGTLKLFESDNTSSVTIASPASLGGDRTVTLPDADVTLVSGTMSTGLTAADITGQTALGAEPADTDEFVLSDAGVLKRVDYSYIKGGGITEVDNWRITVDQAISADTSTVVDSTWERNDTNSDKIGTGLTESSGVFTFPSTGIYLVSFQCNIGRDGDSRYYTGKILVSTNSGVDYVRVARSYTSEKKTTSSTSAGLCTSCTIDVTDASTFRLRFEIEGDEDFNARASSDYQNTGFYCIRLGDT